MAPSSKIGDAVKSGTEACKSPEAEIAEEGAPGIYECPICLELMVDPVVGEVRKTFFDVVIPLIIPQIRARRHQRLPDATFRPSIEDS